MRCFGCVPEDRRRPSASAVGTLRDVRGQKIARSDEFRNRLPAWEKKIEEERRAKRARSAQYSAHPWEETDDEDGMPDSLPGYIESARHADQVAFK